MRDKNAEACCPFFRYVDWQKHHIGCECPIPDTTVSVIFRDNKELDMQMRLFCNGKCTFCELYQSNMEFRHADE